MAAERTVLIRHFLPSKRKLIRILRVLISGSL